MRYLLDTNFLIGFLRQNENYILKLREISEPTPCISSITVVELYAGCRTTEMEATEELLQKLKVINVSRYLAKEAGKIKYHFARRGKTIHTEDAIIGTTAKLYHLTLLTQNIKDFPMLYPSQIEEFPC